MLKKSTCTSHCNEVRSAMRSYLDVLLACTERVGDAYRVGAIFIARTLNEAHQEMCAVVQAEYVAALFRNSVVTGPPPTGAVVDKRETVIGPEGLDPTLAAAFGAWLESAVMPEPGVLKSGARTGHLGEPHFKYGDIIASTSIERMQSALRMLDLHLSRVGHDDSCLCLPKAMEPVSRTSAEYSRRPSSLEEARRWLVTQVRLLRYLNLKGANWASKALKVGAPAPAWSAPPGSGYSSHYHLGELYDCLHRFKPEAKQLRPLRLDAELLEIITSVDEVTERAKKAVGRQSARKRSKARSKSLNPF